MARPKFCPTEEQKKNVRGLSGLGIPQEDIATVLEITAKTMRQHFHHELKRGAVEANLKVANALFKMAISGTNPAATMFWIKTRLHWRDLSANGTTEFLPPQFHIV